MARDVFGRMADGTEVERISLAAGDLTAEILTWGATIGSLSVAGPAGPRPTVLSLASLDHYLAHRAYFGAVVGRCANRIRDGHVELDGRSYEVDRNEAGRTHLHGGAGGFGNRVWTLGEVTGRSVELRLSSADGDQGYPGAVEVSCRYAITDDRTLSIDLVAETDAPTLVNLATHSYFNLDDDVTVLDHRLTVPADAYTPVDGDLIPTGEIRPVDDTPFDFRKARTVRHEVGGVHPGYDHNLVVYADRVAAPRPMATLTGARSGLTLELSSTEPGLQVYDGIFLGEVPVPLAGGRKPLKHGAICLEPQAFPDAVHHPHFPSVVLRPGTTYRQTTIYRFTG